MEHYYQLNHINDNIYELIYVKSKNELICMINIDNNKIYKYSKYKWSASYIYENKLLIFIYDNTYDYEYHQVFLIEGDKNNKITELSRRCYSTTEVLFIITDKIYYIHRELGKYSNIYSKNISRNLCSEIDNDQDKLLLFCNKYKLDYYIGTIYIGFFEGILFIIRPFTYYRYKLKSEINTTAYAIDQYENSYATYNDLKNELQKLRPSMHNDLEYMFGMYNSKEVDDKILTLNLSLILSPVFEHSITKLKKEHIEDLRNEHKKIIIAMLIHRRRNKMNNKSCYPLPILLMIWQYMIN